MRILFVTPYYKPYLGGVERVIEKLAVEFTYAGHFVGVLTTRYSFPRTYHRDLVNKEDDGPVEIYRLSSWPHQPLPFYAAPLTWFSPLEVRQIVENFRPDAIIYMTDKWFGANFWVRLFSNNSKQIWCPVFHDLTPAKFWLRPINWVFSKMVRWVGVVSKLEAEKVKKAYGVSLAKIKLIPWGVSKAAVASPFASSRPEVLIIAVGRISRHKGQKWLVERFLEVAHTAEVPCRLVLIGEAEEPQELEAIRSLLSRGGEWGEQVIVDLSANDQKLAEYYSAADVFALFPEYESFGLVFLEAMSYGVPVLTHNVGALKEVLGNNPGAVLVDRYDQAAAASLLHMINDAAYRKELGLKGQEFVRQNYSWKKCASEFLSLMLKI